MDETFDFHYETGTCALASHIALGQSGCAYRAHRVDFSSGQQRSPEYLRINPKGRVPALVTRRGTITETPAILLYIAQVARTSLAPLHDAFLLAQVHAMNAYLCATVHVASAHRGRGYRWADDDAAVEAMRRKVRSNMLECFTLIEAEMLRGPWVLGDTYSICDPYLFTMSGLLHKDNIDIATFPKVAAHDAAMRADSAVRGVLEIEGASHTAPGA